MTAQAEWVVFGRVFGHLPKIIKVCRTARCFPYLLILFVAACATPPVQEMSDARQAMRAAQEAKAEVYAPKAYADAERLLEKAVIELESGSYATAREDAIMARKKAISAREISMDIPLSSGREEAASGGRAQQ
jgi:hypothetical protein